MVTLWVEYLEVVGELVLELAMLLLHQRQFCRAGGWEWISGHHMAAGDGCP